jgi:hypothetical protein
MITANALKAAAKSIDWEKQAYWLAPLVALLMPIAIGIPVEQIMRPGVFGFTETLRDLQTPLWDAKNYLDIAQHGYYYYTCPADYKYAGQLCGDIGWYPGWPLLLAAVFHLGLPFSVALQAWLLALGFAYAGFALTFRLLRHFTSWQYATWGLVLYAVSPGGFYFLTAFPYGFLLVFMAGYLLTYERFPWRAALLAAAASLTYPQAAIIALVPLTDMLAGRLLAGRPWDWGRAALVSLPFGFGPLALMLWFELQFRRPTLYFEFQHRYGWHLSLPFNLISVDIHHINTPDKVAGSATFTIVALFLLSITYFNRKLPLPYVIYGIVGAIVFICLGTIRSTARYYILLPTALWVATARLTWWRIPIAIAVACAGGFAFSRYIIGVLV